MTEEENKAIEHIKSVFNDIDEYEYTLEVDFINEDTMKIEHKEINSNDIETLLNLIEKLQKENEELEKENLNLKQEKMIDNSSCKPLNNFFDYYDCIPKDKIREKIKEFENSAKTFDYIKMIALEELLKEE